MSMQLLGTASGTTSFSMPTHLAGDIIIVAAFNSASVTIPSLAAGFTSVATKVGSACAMRVGVKIAISSSDAPGTWSNSSELVCHVYRPSASNFAGIGAVASSSGTTNTLTYSGITLGKTDSSSWVAGFIGTTSTSQTITSPPSGMINESSVVGVTAAVAGQDTNGGVASWSSTNVTATGTAGNWVSVILEIQDNLKDEWNTVPIGGAVTYSSNNRQAVAGATLPAIAGCYATHLSTDGKFYMEARSVSGIGDGNLTFGISDPTHTNFMGLSDNGSWRDSAIGSIATFTTFNANDWIALAVDLVNSLAWWKNLTQNSVWNAGGVADPNSNSGGSAYSSGLFSTATIYMFANTTGEGMILNPGTTPFVGTLPNGFLPWVDFRQPYLRPKPRPLLRR